MRLRTRAKLCQQRVRMCERRGGYAYETAPRWGPARHGPSLFAIESLAYSYFCLPYTFLFGIEFVLFGVRFSVCHRYFCLAYSLFLFGIRFSV